MSHKLLARPAGLDPFWDRYFPAHLRPPVAENTLVQDLHRSMDLILGVNPCRLGLSPLCTRENGYDWQGTDCCARCLTFVERAHEAQTVLESDQVRR